MRPLPIFSLLSVKLNPGCANHQEKQPRLAKLSNSIWHRAPGRPSGKGALSPGRRFPLPFHRLPGRCRTPGPEPKSSPATSWPPAGRAFPPRGRRLAAGHGGGLEIPSQNLAHLRLVHPALRHQARASSPAARARSRKSSTSRLDSVAKDSSSSSVRLPDTFRSPFLETLSPSKSDACQAASASGPEGGQARLARRPGAEEDEASRIFTQLQVPAPANLVRQIAQCPL